MTTKVKTVTLKRNKNTVAGETGYRITQLKHTASVHVDISYGGSRNKYANRIWRVGDFITEEVADAFCADGLYEVTIVV